MRGARLTISISILSILWIVSCSFTSRNFIERIPQIDENGVGGTLHGGLFSFPKSFNSYLDNYAINGVISSLVYEPLFEVDSNDVTFKPSLAKRWVISKDKLSYTFFLDKNARFNDGKPVTVDDVIFTFNTIMDTNNHTVAFRVGLSRFDAPIKIDDYTLLFVVKEKHWRNFLYLSFLILPKHLYEGKDFNKDFNTTLPIGSGPYIFGSVKEGYRLDLNRVPNWWGRKLMHNKNLFSFQTIRFKTYGDQTIMFEALKKGELQVQEINTARIWVNETDSTVFTNNYLIKQAIHSDRPQTVQAMHFNLRKEIFQDKNVRLSLTHLFNREQMNKTLMFSQYQMLKSYFPTYFQKNNGRLLQDYNPKKALHYLKQAGWTQPGDDGILVKNGKRFSITIPYYSKGFEKFYTIFQEDAKKLGIEINLEFVSWSRFAELMADFDFDIINLNRGSSYFEDPEGEWHSKYANEKNGHNITGYQNKQADAIIDAMKNEFNFNKRKKLLKQLDDILYEDNPAILGWGLGYVRLVYWNIFDTPDKVLSRINGSTTMDVIAEWKYNPDKWKKMLEAKGQQTALPAEDYKIKF